ncbi:MAG: FmdB family zinc ribbon protein [Pirellula sp.]
MPIYEYDCKSCQAHVEIFLHNSSQQPDCPKCGSKKLEKTLSVISTPVMAGQSSSVSVNPGTCGRSACASGCMFGND